MISGSIAGHGDEITIPVIARSSGGIADNSTACLRALRIPYLLPMMVWPAGLPVRAASVPAEHENDGQPKLSTLFPCLVYLLVKCSRERWHDNMKAAMPQSQQDVATTLQPRPTYHHLLQGWLAPWGKLPLDRQVPQMPQRISQGGYSCPALPSPGPGRTLWQSHAQLLSAAWGMAPNPSCRLPACSRH